MGLSEVKQVPKSPQEYLEQPYARVLIPNDDGSYSAEISEFIGCYADGRTPNEAIKNLEKVALSWIQTCLDRGLSIPEPYDNRDFGGKIALRLPQGLHRQASRMADQDGVSLNQFLLNAIAQYVGAQNLFHSLMRKFEQRLATRVHGMIFKPQLVATTSPQAIAVRGMFASIAEDWDDPDMDVYDEAPEAEAHLNPPAAPPLTTANNEGELKDFGDLLLSVSGDIALLFIRERLAEGAKLHIATSDGKSAPPEPEAPTN